MALRIGLVGAGGMLRYHVEGFRKGGGEIAAIADRSADRAAAIGRELGIPHFDGLPAMLAGTRLDAVSILVPNKFHAPLALEALAAGKHVFCEKPPALNAAEARAMQGAARASGRLLMFNFNNRARPEAQALMAYIRAGEVGRINSAQAVWKRRAGIPGFGGWFTSKAVAGGGPVIDLLHMIDLSLWFMGYPEPEHVLAQTFHDHITDRNFIGPWGVPSEGGVPDVESACFGMVRFRTGSVLMVRNSWAEMIRGESVSATFQGTKAGGAIRRRFAVDGLDETATDACELYTVEHGRQVNRTIVAAPDESMGRVASAENFVRAAAEGATPLNTPDEAVTLMTVIDALYRSAADGAPVALGG